MRFFAFGADHIVTRNPVIGMHNLTSPSTKYRKKPVVIDAVLWDGKAETIHPLAPFENATLPPKIDEYNRLYITSLEGVVVAEIGDYVIKGVQGEIYPCKPGIFAATYERA